VRDFIRAERWSRALFDVRMLSFAERWVSVGRTAGWEAVRGRPRMVSRAVRRDDRLAKLVVSFGAYDNAYVVEGFHSG